MRELDALVASRLDLRWLVAALLVLGGCVDPIGIEGGTGKDISPSDGLVDVDPGDGDDEPDAAPSVPDVDTGEDKDAATDTDAGACPGGSGCFGDPCGENEDCYSNLCSEHMGDSVCTKTCDADCPDRKSVV
jgi:hypothetical protein